MSAFDISWHKQCLRNWVNNHARDEIQVQQSIERLAKARKEIEFLQLQIHEAVNQGKNSFDSDKFLKSKRPQ